MVSLISADQDRYVASVLTSPRDIDAAHGTAILVDLVAARRRPTRAHVVRVTRLRLRQHRSTGRNEHEPPGRMICKRT